MNIAVKNYFARIMDALALYKNKTKWNKLIKNGMKQDFSWQKSAKQYLTLYENILQK